MAEKRYYWLKLHKDFFKRHEIRIIEDMPNGKDYILFYLKLLVESVTHEGNLRFSDAIPYNDNMLATITNTNVDVVKAALNIFLELKMIEVLDDQTLYMADVQNMIGSETAAAVKKRNQRVKKQALPETNGDIVPELSQNCPIENREKRIDKEEEEREKNITDLLTDYTLSKENFDFSAFTEEERRQQFGSTGLTIAEYTVLARYVREYALNTYCKKMKDYPDCEDRFKLVLTWAIKDDNIKAAYKSDFEGSI